MAGANHWRPSSAVLKHRQQLLHTAQVGAPVVVASHREQCRADFAVAQVRCRKLQASLEISSADLALVAFGSRGEESPLQPRGDLVPITLGSWWATLGLRNPDYLYPSLST